METVQPLLTTGESLKQRRKAAKNNSVNFATPPSSRSVVNEMCGYHRIAKRFFGREISVEDTQRYPRPKGPRAESIHRRDGKSPRHWKDESFRSRKPLFFVDAVCSTEESRL